MTMQNTNPVESGTLVSDCWLPAVACLRLVSAILMEISTDWQTAEQRYIVFIDERAIKG